MDAKTKELLKPLAQAYAKAPALPTNAKDFLVTVAPWAALIFGALVLVGSIGGLGLFTVFSPLAYLYAGAGYTTFLLISAVVGIVEGVILLLAFIPLRKRKLRGWNLLVWSEVLAIVGSAVSLNVGSVVWAIVVAAIAFYFLFQVEAYYK
jgi:hypothetical protein